MSTTPVPPGKPSKNVKRGRLVRKVGPELKERLRNALAGATAGGTLGVILKDSKGAKWGAAAGALAGLTQRKRVSVQTAASLAAPSMC